MSTLKVDGIRSNSASSDAITLASDGTCTANITNNLSNRNLIINGAMQVAQRGTSSTAGGRKTLDRFQFNWFNGDQVGITQSQSTDAPPDFSKSFKVDVTTAETALEANESAWINYVLEARDCQQLNYGSSDAKSVTLSFWVKSYQTGTFAVNLNKYPDNTNRSITSTYTVNQSATWEKKTITFVGDTGGGGIDDDNGAGIYMYFFVVAGSDYKGSSANTNQWANYTNAGWANGHTVDLFSSTDNYFQITGVQLEVDHNGSGVATDFEHRSYGQELELCRRYFQVVVDDGSGKSFGNGTCYTASNMHLILQLCPNMRATPTIDQTTGSNYYRMFRNGGEDTFDQFSLEASSSEKMVDLYATGATGSQGASALLRTDNAAAKIRLSAEL